MHIVRSDGCGLGKSQKIFELIATKANHLFARIPFYGDLNRENLIQLHQKKLFFEEKNFKLEPRSTHFGIHYDVYPTADENKDLNVVMFELLILGSLTDSQFNRFYLPENSKIYVELSQSLNSKFFQLLFQLFETTIIKWNFSHIKIQNNPKDKYQKVCKYL